MYDSTKRDVRITIPAEIDFGLLAKDRAENILEALHSAEVGVVGKDRALRVLISAINADRNTARISIKA
jgi:hypothetical protein